MDNYSEGIETKKDIVKKVSDTARYWHKEIRAAQKYVEKSREKGRKAVDRYKDENERKIGKYNILWSNTETLKPALFSNVPEPDIRRRYLDDDPVSRAVSELLERALSYSVDKYNFYGTMTKVIEDVLLPGIGQAWVVYEPTIAKTKVDIQAMAMPDGSIQTIYMSEAGYQVEQPEFEDDGTAYLEELAEQELTCEYVYWEDYLESPARCWSDVRWVARRHEMTRDELTEQFGEKGKDVPLTKIVNGIGEREDEVHDIFKRAEVWEIWDKTEKRVVYISLTYDKLIDSKDDPYELEGFFPCPEPLMSYCTTDGRVPIPEYHVYRDQAEELDRVSERIVKLVDALRRRGVYDESMKEMRKLSNAGDNELIGVKNWTNLTSKGGLNNVIEFEDITSVAQVLLGLYQQRDQIINTIYQITGLSDLLRGQATDPREKATTQRLKAQYGNRRLSRRQYDVERFIRDIYRIKAEIMAEHFEPEILQQMTGVQVFPEMIALMRDDKVRSYNIDIESESTVQPDADMEKQNRIEFLSAIGQFTAQFAPLMQSGVITPDVFREFLMFGIRPFKVGRNLEEVIDQAMQQGQGQPQQPEGEAKAQADMQAKQMDVQAQIAMKRMDIDARLEESRMKKESDDLKSKVKLLELQQKGELEAQDLQLEAQKILLESVEKGRPNDNVRMG